MYFPTIRKHIAALEEKGFYSVAVMYLQAIGYKDVSIVDGTGDGGRDVVCSRKDLRIQLSVRRDWDSKINEEADTTAAMNKTQLIYVTNRLISQSSEAAYFHTKYRQAGKVDITIHDINRIATTLSQPGLLAKALELFGVSIEMKVPCTPKEIAISNVLIFGKEAKELREAIIEANIKAYIYKNGPSVESAIIENIDASLPGADLRKAAGSALSRLRVAGKIVTDGSKVNLSKNELTAMEASEIEYNAAISDDIEAIEKLTGLSRKDSELLLQKSIELLARRKDFNGVGVIEEDIRHFISDKGLSRSRSKIYECLSSTYSAKKFAYGETIDHIFSTNTFDIYRALDGRANVEMLLDTSVALPLIFGLEFGVANSRFGVAASSLKAICQAHNIKMNIPRPYLNEMASHGLKALEYTDIYNTLPKEAKIALRASKNAYLSHYTYIIDELVAAGTPVKLKEFLEHFGLRRGASLAPVENRIRSIVEGHGIKVEGDVRWTRESMTEVSKRKPSADRLIVQHDAAVYNMILGSENAAYIFATWDNAMIELVENLGRVFADNPAKVTDYLSMVEGVDYETEQSQEMLTTLLHVDEVAVEKLARKIGQIKNTEQAFRLRTHIDEVRTRSTSQKEVTEEMSRFLDEDLNLSPEDGDEIASIVQPEA